MSREKDQRLSKEEKENKQQYGLELYKNLSENEKQKISEYRTDIIWKNKNASQIKTDLCFLVFKEISKRNFKFLLKVNEVSFPLVIIIFLGGGGGGGDRISHQSFQMNAKICFLKEVKEIWLV